MSSDGLVLRGVTAGFGPHVAVDDVDLRIERGEVVALLGPSGCGKSTLLRCIAGLHPLTTGSVHLAGRDLSRVPTHERGIGMMFQHHALFPHRTVTDNIAFGLRMQGEQRDAQLARVQELLDLVDLAGYGDRTIDTLSGGEAQRVALARALAPQPDVLLLDEPLAALDRSLRDRLVTEVRRIVTEVGITTIHVTHDQDEAATIADRVALMRRGRIVRVGDLDAMAAEPQSVAVAEFLGLETIWRTTVTAAGAITTPFGPRPAPDEPAGATVALLLRSDRVGLSTTPNEGVPAAVVSTRRARDGWLTRCATDAGQVIAAEAPRRIRNRTPVWLTFDPADAELLDQERSRP